MSNTQLTDPSSVHILLAGASGIPGRYILNSLLRFITHHNASRSGESKVKLTVLKRAGTSKPRTADGEQDVEATDAYQTAFVGDYNNIPILSQSLQELDPDIVISALNAEPAPVLDNHLIDALSLLNRARSSAQSTSTRSHTNNAGTSPGGGQSVNLATGVQQLSLQSGHTMANSRDSMSTQLPGSSSAASTAGSKRRRNVLFINGFTLDLLHPSILTTVPPAGLATIQPKIQLAHRLRSLAEGKELDYVTIVCAGFIDYTLLKGYAGLDVNSLQTTLYGEGDADITGCSLQFVGDAVVKIVESRVLAGNEEMNGAGSHATTSVEEEAFNRVKNSRVRIAETVYSGQKLADAVTKVTGRQVEVVGRVELSEMRSNDKGVILYLNWVAAGASGFFDDGLGFGVASGANTTATFELQRRSLEDIVRQALESGF